jgi:hypothetical protein
VKEEAMHRGKRLLFGTLFGTILLVVTLVGIEFLSSFMCPTGRHAP